MLTGTPMLAKPDEIFTILSAIRPDLYSNYHEFANRYCEYISFNRVKKFKESSNTFELNFLLDNFMIRRLKSDVLDQLPDKIRQRIEVEVDSKKVNIIKLLLSKDADKLKQFGVDLSKKDKLHEDYDPDLYNNDIDGYIFKVENNSDNNEVSSLYTKAYKLTGEAKIEVVCQYIDLLLEENQKFLIFAHHMTVLDAIEEYLCSNHKAKESSILYNKDNNIKKNKNLGYIRIDGKTAKKQRQVKVDYFQTQDDIKIALLSITACATGLTLTAANIVIFAELYFTPAIMMQAEDRVHRIGQKRGVQIKYLIAEGTLDEHIFELLETKIECVSNALDAERKNMGITKISKVELNKNNTSSGNCIDFGKKLNNKNIDNLNNDLVKMFEKSEAKTINSNYCKNNTSQDGDAKNRINNINKYNIDDDMILTQKDIVIENNNNNNKRLEKTVEKLNKEGVVTYKEKQYKIENYFNKNNNKDINNKSKRKFYSNQNNTRSKSSIFSNTSDIKDLDCNYNNNIVLNKNSYNVSPDIIRPSLNSKKSNTSNYNHKDIKVTDQLKINKTYNNDLGNSKYRIKQCKKLNN